MCLHRGKTVDTGAAQCAQQESFCLIVLMVGQGQPFVFKQMCLEGGMAGITGGRFQALAGVARNLGQLAAGAGLSEADLHAIARGNAERVFPRLAKLAKG